MKNLIEVIEENGATEELKAKVANNAQALAEYLEYEGFDVVEEMDMEHTHTSFDLSIAFDDNCKFYQIENENHDDIYIAIIESGDSYYAKLSNKHFHEELYIWANQKLYNINKTEIERIDKLNSDGSEYSAYDYKY